MKIFAFICTRQESLPNYTQKLLSYLGRCKIETKLLINKDSIFTAYTEAVQEISVEDEDIVIFCHDDIDILMDPQEFVRVLIRGARKENSGFMGPAGTTHLSESAIWWDHQLWSQQKHRGFVIHGENIYESEYTFYGSPGRVVCLDGLFLAIGGKSLKEVDLSKPKHFEGDWDFYDIHYTIQAHKKGLYNTVEPLFILHRSKGDLVGRDSWHKNRDSFIKATDLPVIV